MLDIGLKVTGIVLEQRVVNIVSMVAIVHIIVIGCIAVIKNPINCNSLIDYASFII